MKTSQLVLILTSVVDGDEPDDADERDDRQNGRPGGRLRILCYASSGRAEVVLNARGVGIDAVAVHTPRQSRLDGLKGRLSQPQVW